MTSDCRRRSNRANSVSKFDNYTQRSSRDQCSRGFKYRETNPLRHSSISRNTYSKKGKRSSSRFGTVQNSARGSIKNFNKDKIIEISDYLIKLSLLILELQCYSASVVASA